MSVWWLFRYFSAPSLENERRYGFSFPVDSNQYPFFLYDPIGKIKNAVMNGSVFGFSISHIVEVKSESFQGQYIDEATIFFFSEDTV